MKLSLLYTAAYSLCHHSHFLSFPPFLASLSQRGAAVGVSSSGEGGQQGHLAQGHSITDLTTTAGKEGKKGGREGGEEGKLGLEGLRSLCHDLSSIFTFLLRSLPPSLSPLHRPWSSHSQLTSPPSLPPSFPPSLSPLHCPENGPQKPRVAIID